jgi:hypothetical protein
MDDYPASDHIPDPDRVEVEYTELMEFLSNNQDMRKAAKGSLQQSLYAGGGAMAGGMLLGPVGGLIGGVTGSLMGFFRADDYDGAVQQILQLEGARKARLVEQVHKVLLNAGASVQQFESAEAFRATLVEFASQRAVRDQVWRTCLESIQDE